MLTNSVSVPMIKHGGANSTENIQETIDLSTISAIAAGSFLLFSKIKIESF